MFIRIFVTLISLIHLASCTHTQKQQNPKSDTLKKFSFYYLSSTHLETEPCGCSIKPLGGIHRLNNFASIYLDESSFLVTSGTSFLPWDKQKKSKKKLWTQGKTLIQGWNEAGLTAYAPSLVDIENFTDTQIQELNKLATFSILTTNVLSKKTKKPLFKEVEIKENKELKFYIVGLVALQQSSSSSIEVISPYKALKDIVTKYSLSSDGKSLLVILTSGGQFEEDLLNTFQEVPFILLSAKNVKEFLEIQQLGAKGILGSIIDRGRAILRLSFEPQPTFKQFYNENSAQSLADARKNWVEHLKQLESQIANTKEDSIKEALLLKKQRLEFQIKRTEGTSTLNESSWKYNFEYLPLDASFE